MKGARNPVLPRENPDPPKPKRRDRHEKLMDERLAILMEPPNPVKVRDAVDYLFFEIDLLIHQVEHLQGLLGGPPVADPVPVFQQIGKLTLKELKDFVKTFNGPSADRRKKR
jgi:hypothetical protein